MSLRQRVFKLAYDREELRPYLLPLLQRTAAKDIWIALRELPPSLQRALKSVGYRRKDIRVEADTTYSPSESSAAFEGSRGFIVVVNMETGQSKQETGSWGGATPLEPGKVEHDRKNYPIPNNGAVIVGESGGRGTFARIKVHPQNLAKMLPSGAGEKLTEEENKALNIMGGIKGGYRAKSFSRYDLGPYNLKQNPLLQDLLKKGLIQANRAGAMKITTKGRNAFKRMSVY